MAALDALLAAVVARWPEHKEFLEQRFAGESAEQIAVAQTVADKVWTLVEPDLDETVASYRWVCETMLEEEIFFRRHGRYRHTSVREVERAGYLRDPYMSRYQQGLLLSQVLWLNHARVIESYLRDFLDHRDGKERLLEVGPGHGLFLALAAERLGGEVAGWDISQPSLAYTRRNLARLGVHSARLVQHDISHGPLDGAFDLVVASELLEHVDRPAEVLRALRGLLGDDGLIFLNVPVNSPAPDHVYLWRSPEDFFAFVASCGIVPRRTATFPMTGYTEQRARRNGYTISCVVVGARDDRE